MPRIIFVLYFLAKSSISNIFSQINGVLIYNGIEANIYGEKGEIDVHPSIIDRLDYIIASMHTPCIDNLGEAGNTKAHPLTHNLFPPVSLFFYFI